MSTSTKVPPIRPDTTPVRSRSIPAPRAFALLPLRLFLGITFLYAGIQKLTDPQFFHPGSPDFIGEQITIFAQTSPLSPLLLQFASPNAILFGMLIAYGEVAIGLGTLVGFLLRPASIFGLILNIILWLSASWTVYPYFYGSDIVFACCWLVLLLNGPSGTGFLSLDELLFAPRMALWAERGQHARLYSLAFFLGLPITALDANSTASRLASPARRGLLLGLFTGGVATALFVAFSTTVLGGRQANDALNQTPTATPSATQTPEPTPTASSTPTSDTMIAKVSDVPINSALSFTSAESGEPALLIHLANDQFVAYDATCTHAGCTVDYDPDSKLIVCPCHGSTFDPAHNGTVKRPPARRSLAPMAIRIDSATGSILPG
ncbi:TQO small subunit DoxD [Ktedonospora formicarum]|uniref:Rieske domain-containing protein n=1 Tax=Ktedonospora formicarum TaxID=2778364 RepID=A0A8J3I090_9CHLR|nr:TQO small subunit DoxD [Ktedonospora formicarum]GHO44273.1 hypothetical protein KSX_24360 [Ktedonospora formicarum]